MLECGNALLRVTIYIRSASVTVAERTAKMSRVHFSSISNIASRSAKCRVTNGPSRFCTIMVTLIGGSCACSPAYAAEVKNTIATIAEVGFKIVPHQLKYSQIADIGP